jgi:hypothetical protein
MNYTSGILGQTYQQVSATLNIILLNSTTTLELASPVSNLNVIWNSMLNITVSYQSVFPLLSNLTTANFYYSIAGTLYSGQMSEVGNGLYNLTIMNLPLDIGAYTLDIFGWKSNYQQASASYSLLMLAVPTTFAINVDSQFLYAQSSLRGSQNETIHYQIVFTDTNGTYLGSNAILSSVIQGVPSNGILSVVYNVTANAYDVNINVNDYPLGTYNIQVQAYKSNFISQSQILSVNFVDYWNTSLNLIVPPTFYPWGNNASFVVQYNCIQDPRTGVILNGATVHHLDITTEINGNQTTVVTLHNSNRGTLWNWFDLGGGEYLIWFNTSVLTVTGRTVFYAVPTVSIGVYRTATTLPYIWVAPVGTTLTPFVNDFISGSAQSATIILPLYNSTTISAVYNITETDSSLCNSTISGASVSYVIQNDADKSVFQTGTLTDESNGLYGFTLNAITIGNYTLTITSSLTNFSTGMTSLFFNVRARQIHTTFGSEFNVVGDTGELNIAQNHDLRFNITAIDSDNGQILTGAIFTITIGGTTLNFTDSAANPGLYSIFIPSSVLQNVPAQTSPVLICSLSLANYTTAIVRINLNVGLPVDPWLGIPYEYWLIIGVTIGAMVAIYAISKGIQNARIPMIIKQIELTRKLITGKKSISNEKITVSQEEDFVERYGNDWRILDLDLASIIHPKVVAEDKSLAPGDQ